eukprot:CAMPEP_0194344628 /NCGR_PEP_ID=MMETSP0171-20130528/102260_1 /TAXON_ID=218684 /ORGANISM="Corethron pennatum, Strain L29A3" /LENGTH=63 /DNA_ID=CAMNT_0039111367 /DNA_START=499 /DNA_END=690 /DNA_ORIENTATION=+
MGRRNQEQERVRVVLPEGVAQEPDEISGGTSQGRVGRHLSGRSRGKFPPPLQRLHDLQLGTDP